MKLAIVFTLFFAVALCFPDSQGDWIRGGNVGPKKNDKEIIAELTELVENIVEKWKKPLNVAEKDEKSENFVKKDPRTKLEDESFSILSSIVNKLLETLLKTMESLFLKVNELIGKKSEIDGEQVLQKFRDTIIKLFMEPIMKLSSILSNIVGGLDNASNVMKKMLESHFDKLKGISSETVKFLKNIVDEVLKKIKKEKEAEKVESTYVFTESFTVFLNSILKPIYSDLHKMMVAINELADSKTEAAQKHIKIFKASLIASLQQPWIKIAHALSKILGSVDKAIAYMKTTLSNFINNLGGISPVTKYHLNDVIDEVLKSINIKDGESEEKEDFYLLLDKTISIIFKPIIDQINQRLEAIKKAMRENMGNTKEIIDKHAEALAELIRPYMIRVINLLNDLGADGKSSVEQMKKLLTIIINNLSGINQANKDIFLSLIDYMSKILAGKLPGEIVSSRQLQYDAQESINYSLIENIIKPIVTLLQKQISAISQSLKDQAGNLSETAKQHLKQLAIILKPIVERIIKNGAGIIDASKDIKDQVFQALKYIFGIVGKIPGVSAELMADILKYLVDMIVGTKN